MKIRVSSLPYRIVLLASFLPWLAAYFDSKMVALSADGVMLLAFALWLLIGGRLAASPRILTLLLGVVLIDSVIMVFSDLGIGSGGLVLLALEVFVFYQWFAAGRGDITVMRAHHWVSNIYRIHLGFLAFELAMRFGGFVDLFSSIAGHTTMVAGYKLYNTGALLNYLGVSGLNSLLLGSQTASQLTLFALFWFLPFIRSLPPEMRVHNLKLWFFVALVVYPFNATMTSNALLLLILMLLLFVFRITFFSGAAREFMLFVIVMVFFQNIYEALTFRINSMRDVEVYLHAYFHVVEVFSEMPTYLKIFGFGSDVSSSPLTDTNFGLGALLIHAGLLIFVAFLIFFLALFLRAVRVWKLSRKLLKKDRATVLMVVMNSILALAWLASLVHYTPAVELGGRHIFAFHISVALFFMGRMRIREKDVFGLLGQDGGLLRCRRGRHLASDGRVSIRPGLDRLR